MIRFSTEPWQEWPRNKTAASDQRRSPFKAGYNDTINRLVHELEKLGVESAIVQMDGVSRKDVSNDGLPRATTRTLTPGVIVSFERDGRPLNLPCDQFLTWPDNLRAIALALEHLRGADRYGVTQSGEQYRGWEALPPPGHTVVVQNLEWALDTIARLSGVPQTLIKENPVLREAAIKAAKINVHPDKGGKASDAGDVGEAAEILKKQIK